MGQMQTLVRILQNTKLRDEWEDGKLFICMKKPQKERNLRVIRSDNKNGGVLIYTIKDSLGRLLGKIKAKYPDHGNGSPQKLARYVYEKKLNKTFLPGRLAKFNQFIKIDEQKNAFKKRIDDVAWNAGRAIKERFTVQEYELELAKHSRERMDGYNRYAKIDTTRRLLSHGYKDVPMTRLLAEIIVANELHSAENP